MNASRFDQIVRNRAQQRVEARVNRFRQAIGDAFRELGTPFQPTYYNGWAPGHIPDDVDAVLKILSTGGYLKKADPNDPGSRNVSIRWPKVLWEAEQEAVEKELLATMDEMQKALVAPPPSADAPQPVEEAKA